VPGAVTQKPHEPAVSASSALSDHSQNYWATHIGVATATQINYNVLHIFSDERLAATKLDRRPGGCIDELQRWAARQRLIAYRCVFFCAQKVQSGS
jgi:hypothetical protein